MYTQINTVASGAHKTTTYMKKEQKSVFLSAEEHLTSNVIHMLLNGSQQLIYVESRVTIASNPIGYKESNSVTNSL